MFLFSVLLFFVCHRFLTIWNVLRLGTGTITHHRWKEGDTKKGVPPFAASPLRLSLFELIKWDVNTTLCTPRR